MQTNTKFQSALAQALMISPNAKGKYSAISEINSKSKPVFLELLSKLNSTKTEGTINELTAEALEKLEVLERRLSVVDAPQLALVRDLRINIMEFVQFKNSIPKERTQSRLEYAATISTLDQIVSLTDRIGSVKLLRDLLEEKEEAKPVEAATNATGDNKTKQQATTKLRTDLTPKADLILTIDSGHDRGNNLNYYSGTPPYSSGGGYRSKGSDTTIVLSSITERQKEPGTAELAQTLDYIGRDFPIILASGDIDQIFSALGHAFHNLHLNNDDSLDTKVSFNANQDRRNSFRDDFINALKSSTDLRRATRAYISQHHETIGSSSMFDKSLTSWLRNVFYDFKYRDRSILLEAFSIDDMAALPDGELQAIYKFATESRLALGEREELLINLINSIEEKLKNEADKPSLVALRDKVLDQIGSGLEYSTTGEKKSLVDTIKLYCRYRESEFAEALAAMLPSNRDYFFQQGNDGSNLAEWIKRDNPAPSIFKVGNSKLAFTEGFTKKVLEKFKPIIIESLKNFDSNFVHVYIGAIERIIKSARFLNECGIETRALFTGEELLSIFPNRGRGQIFDISDPKFQEAMKHRAVARGVRPFEEGDLAIANAELFKLLTYKGISPEQTEISEEKLAQIVQKNVDYAINEANKWNRPSYYAIDDLFAAYISNDVKGKFLANDYKCLLLLDEIEKVLGLDLDHFFPEATYKISDEQQQAILGALKPEQLVDLLNDKINGYLEGLNIPFKNHLSSKQVSDSLFLANLCKACSDKYYFSRDLKETLFLLDPDASVKAALEPIFHKYLSPEVKAEFFSEWDSLEDFDIRLIASRIIRGLQSTQAASRAETFLHNAGDLSKRQAAMATAANDFASRSCMAEVLQKTSYPWIFIKNFSSREIANAGAAFIEQSNSWYKASKFAEEISEAKGRNDYLRLLASRANIGFNSSSPALLPGSGEFATLRTYTPGDDPKYIDWAATFRRGNDEIYIKSHIDDIHLKQKEYIVDLEALAMQTKNPAGHPTNTVDTKKIESLLLELYGNFMKGNNQNLQIRYQSNLILKLDKRRLASIFQQGANSWLQDTYSRRTGLCDLYLTLQSLVDIVSMHHDPAIIRPVIADDWEPPNSRSQIIICPANHESLIHPTLFGKLNRWAAKGCEILEVNLAPKQQRHSPRKGILAS